jgi:hypothetical protein
VIYGVTDTIEMGAMSAAIDVTRRFDTVTDDAVTALPACRCEATDRALERIESMRLAVHYYDEGILVIVATLFASSHCRSPWIQPNGFNLVAITLERRNEGDNTHVYYLQAR